MTKTEILQNLKCKGCANAITESLNKIPGVSKAKVEIETHSVSFDFSDEIQIDIVERKLASFGYPIDKDSNSIFQKAKSFVSCTIGRIGDK